MFANQPTMIAASRPLRTVQAVFAGYRPEFEKIKPSQWLTWRLGDSAAVGTTFRVTTGQLCEALELKSGERVLNVTAGNRSTPLAGAESLPFRNAAFDVVLSGFAAMFAPDPYRISQELLRVCRRGGRIGLTCWTPQGFNGQLISLVDKYSTKDSASVNSAAWGSREFLNELFGHSADALGATMRTHTWRYPSREEWLDAWCANGGPLHNVQNAIDPDFRGQFSFEILALVDRFNEANDGSMVVDSEYLEFLVHKSSWRV